MEAKKILCVTAKGLSKKNEQFLNELEFREGEETAIELFTEARGISLGSILKLRDIICETPQTIIEFYTDMVCLAEFVQKLFKDSFEKISLLPDKSDSDAEIYHAYSELTNGMDLSFFAPLVKVVRTLRSYFLHAGNKIDQEVADEATEQIVKVIDEYEVSQQNLFWLWFEEYLTLFDESDRLFRFYGLSLLLCMRKKRIYIEALYEEIHADCYGVEQWFWLFHQLKRFCLENVSISGMDIAQRLYDEVWQIWKEACREFCKPIPIEERRRDRVAVIVLQFLGTRHAPTKTALERIETLNREMGKQVLVVHSAEQMTRRGQLPFYQAAIGCINHKLDGMNPISKDKDFSFPLYQPRAEMPDFGEVQAIIDMLRKYKPYEILVLGNYCLLGDIVAQMIPTICISMTFSAIPLKQNQFVTVGKHLTEQDFAYIAANGCDREQYIESTFTFEPTKQTTTLSREEMELPKDGFLCSIVGIRLDSEVTEEFLRAIEPTFAHGCYIVFAGVFQGYQKLCESFPELKEHSAYIGYQKDILAFQEICDLYINPPRLGGGFSVAEAFCKGKPAVTLPHGDVAAAAGPEFWVKDLAEMADTIVRYREDRAFYCAQSETALARSQELFDSRGALEHILREAENRKGFF